MRDYIRFHVNGREHRVGGAGAFTTLSRYLRYDARATGTKIVCEEGDCGACTVLLRRSAGSEYQPLNSCILAIAQLDGASIVTVEGLQENGRLSRVQDAMVTCHGAQCGYCTPGFVVAMTALFERADSVDEHAVERGLTGNLCRCTGYEPIIKAALAVDGRRMPRIRERYPELPNASDPVRIESNGRTFFAPARIEDAIAFKAAHERCTIVQGGTDVGVWVNKRDFTAPAMMWLGKISELNRLDAGEGTGAPLVVGANVTLSGFAEAVRERIPELYGILDLFGAPQIRNAGTLAGNIANASPIADTLPYLFVAEAELEIRGTTGSRRVPITSFYRGYKELDLRADEIITRVTVPVVRDTLRLYKVSRRRDLDISAFTAAIRLRMADGRIAEGRVAYGGVAPVVLRLAKTEEHLRGKRPSLELFESAGAIARGEVTPISDVRGSKDYRLQLAENIMMKFWFEEFGAPPDSRPGPDRPFAEARA
jgi:xanthine dehydrogenase small subunit